MGFGKGVGIWNYSKIYTPDHLVKNIQYNNCRKHIRKCQQMDFASRRRTQIVHIFPCKPSLTFCHIVPSPGQPCWGDPRIELVDGDLFCRHNTPYSVDIGFYIQPNFWGASQLERMLIVMFCFIYSDPAINPVDANTMMPWWHSIQIDSS